MTLQQYNNLSQEYQTHILQHKAVIIATLHGTKAIYTLFQVYGFYLEVCSIGAVGQVTSINYFEEMELLEPYLQSININSVYNVLNKKN